MDPGRFGRVLGVGARLAAKTVVSAVDAASAPNPNAGARSTAAAPAQKAGPTAAGEVDQGRRRSDTAARVERARAQVGQTGRGLRQGSRRFGEAVWGPVVKLSGVLWLELTGVFFGLFALSAAVGAWRLRWALGGAADRTAHNHLLVTAGIAVLFGYFCVSSFARAHRRGRGR